MMNFPNLCLALFPHWEAFQYLSLSCYYLADIDPRDVVLDVRKNLYLDAELDVQIDYNLKVFSVICFLLCVEIMNEDLMFSI